MRTIWEIVNIKWIHCYLIWYMDIHEAEKSKWLNEKVRLEVSHLS
ncbi:hypothetical protein ACFFIS_00050 [Virgibacillus soli]|uniref:Uncharacterized protein n=1 Tax=Paracerasibacillus soli TaxID=480284 RepID=A0ABU5CV46_9BACI|nr:hypothetical protein [Virgibacillus soli]MDY0409283.1 hypothetical protein [Virgibacillus soli]